MKRKLLNVLLAVLTVAMVMPAFVAGAAFSDTAGNALVRGNVNGQPFYTTLSAGAIYTSVDGGGWVQRYAETENVLKGFQSIAYGEKMCIGVYDKSLIAALFTCDMNFKETVYNYVTADEKFITLIPEIYYDKLSGLFFCHGFGASDNTYRLYYTDGTLTTAAYNGNDVSALEWSVVTGDYLSTHLWTGTLDLDDIAAQSVAGDGKGNIVTAYKWNYGTTSSAYTDKTEQMRRCGTIIKAGSDGALTAAYWAGSASWSPVAAVTDNGVAVLEAYRWGQGIWVADLNTLDMSSGKVSLAANNVLPTDVFPDQTEVKVMVANGNDVYVAKGAAGDTSLYKFTVSYNDAVVSLTDAVNVLDGVSFGSADTSALMLKDVSFDKDGNPLLLYSDASKSYLYLLDEEEGILTEVTSDATKVSVVGEDEISLNIVKDSASDHTIRLHIGDDETEDAMSYTPFNSDEAKYALDLDGIDKNGIFAWDDAVEGEYKFNLIVRSADYPSVMKTVEITATVTGNVGG